MLLDAGTGIREVTSLLHGGAFHGTILLTHLHWDHWQGLPFFGAGDRDDAEVRVLVPAGGTSPREVLRLAMSPPHFPIGPEGLRGRWSFDPIDEGTQELEGLQVTSCEVPHKGGRTFGYRISSGGWSFAYVPDHRPAAGGSERDAVVAWCRGVDLLIHDAQFVAGEEAVARDYGHATVDDALGLAVEARVGELVLFHHAPGRTDDEIDAIAERAAHGGVAVSVAREHTERGL